VTVATKQRLKVADEAWIAAALLQRENPDETDFSVDQIVARARKESITGELRPGVYVHVVQHCVANRAPNPGRYRMLFETGKNRRRLYRSGDSSDPARDGSKTMPEREDIPVKYQPLLEWYAAEFSSRKNVATKIDPLLALKGSGRKIWADEHADEYVRRLREGWE
jgi:hypothetical protein